MFCGFVRFPPRYVKQFGGVILSPPMFRFRPANGKPVQWRGGKPDELVLPQPSEFRGKPPRLPSLRLVTEILVIAKLL